MIRIRFLLRFVFRARYVSKKHDTYEFQDSKIVLRSIFRILEFIRIIFFWYVRRTKHETYQKTHTYHFFWRVRRTRHDT